MTTWIFQGNPDIFDLYGYIRAHSVITWTVQQQLADRIAVGDRVFMWRDQGSGKESAGVIGAGYILEPARRRVEQEAALPFWRTPPEGSAPRVVIRIERSAAQAKEIVRRDWLRDDPVLRGLHLPTNATEPNDPIEPIYARRLEALWRNTGRDWSEAESIGGLWAYERTYGGEVSKLPGSPVAEVALKIGRAVTSVYNKVLNFRHIDPRDIRAGLSGAGATDRRVWAMFYEAATPHLDRPRLDADYARHWSQNGDAVPDEPEAAQATERSPPTPTSRRPRGQGYEADPLVRRAVERRAMTLADTHYRAHGFAVEDTSAAKPYDLRCTRDGAEVRVEVKGTRNDGSEVEVTVGEVENARGTGWRTDLFVVSTIAVSREDGAIEAYGGSSCIIQGWRPAVEDLSATRFRYTVSPPEIEK
jgi:hypothetical protein